MRPFVNRPLQCFNCQKFGHQARTCRSEVHTCRYCAGRHPSSQCKDNETRTLKCVNCGQGQATTSRLCPKKLEAESKVKPAHTPAHKVTATQQVNKPLLLHNIYRVDGVLDITTPLTREPRSIMVGDFNATDEVWCRYHNRAGNLLNEQLQYLDNFFLMKHPQVWTTINNTAINLSLLPVDIAPLTNWSIYPGLLRDHLAVLLEIPCQHFPERGSVPKRWLTQHADWELYREHITRTTTRIEWTYVDTNETTITQTLLEAAELSIPKSSGKSSATPYWKNNMGIRMAKHIYNSKLKTYRRHTSPTKLEQVQTAYKEYTQLCTHVRNQSWNQWITDCINSAEVWRRIQAAKVIMRLFCPTILIDKLTRTH